MNVRDHGLELRTQAIGMLNAGMTQKDVALKLRVSLRSIERWWNKEKLGESQKTKSRPGRNSTVKKAAKIMISKSLGKRGKSTRKLARIVSNRGYPISHSTVYRYLRDSLGVRSFKRPKIARLTAKMKENRLKFAEFRKEWTVEDWKCVLWSDEAPFQLFNTPNRQNDRVWARNSAEVEPCVQVKFPGKINVWGMMSHRAVSELHIVPQKQTINDCYYRNYILEKTCKDAIERRSDYGSIMEKSMLSNMSNFIFMQDGAPAHTANLTQVWCAEHFPGFWRKGEWPGNSPDLNPIENLWSILKDSVSQMENVTKIEDLIFQVKKAWASIDPNILENLVASMPDRIKSVIDSRGDYINK